MPTTDSTGTNGQVLVDDIARLIKEAEEAGLERPGRPTLVRLTGAKDHEVRKAMKALERQDGDADASAEDKPANVGPGGGKGVAWAGFLFGSAASIAANVLAARIVPEGAAPGWHASMVAQVGAGVWPVALLLAVEALSRVKWPTGNLWRLARYGGTSSVALFAAVISYTHIHEVLLSWGYNDLSAGVGPLVIDGLMAVCGFAMLATSRGTVDASAVKS